jgi:hypothetical protein
MDRDPGLGGGERKSRPMPGREGGLGKTKQKAEPGRRWPQREGSGILQEGLRPGRNGGGPEKRWRAPERSGSGLAPTQAGFTGRSRLTSPPRWPPG